MKKIAYIDYVELRNYYQYSVGLSVEAVRQIMSTIDYSETVEVTDMPTLGMVQVKQGENTAIVPHGVVAYVTQ